mgnify:FL=1
MAALVSTLSPARLVYRQGDAVPALRLRPGGSPCGCSEALEVADYTGWQVTIAGPVTVVLDGVADGFEIAAELAADTLAVPGDYLVTLAAVDADGAARTWPSEGGVELRVAPVLT